MVTAFVTVGEGYHNFHHQFPMDYRNAIKWYQYDPTKWFIITMQWLGLASHLKAFPENEVKKGQLTMELKKLKAKSDSIEWPMDSNDLPVVPWDSCTYLFIHMRTPHSSFFCSPRTIQNPPAHPHLRLHPRRIRIQRRT